MLSEKQILSYQALYKSYYGEDISQEEAYEQGEKLKKLLEVLYRPMPEAEYKKLQDRRQANGNN